MAFFVCRSVTGAGVVWIEVEGVSSVIPMSAREDILGMISLLEDRQSYSTVAFYTFSETSKIERSNERSSSVASQSSDGSREREKVVNAQKGERYVGELIGRDVLIIS